MKTSCFVLCCVLALGALVALPTPGLTQSSIEIRVVVIPGQTIQPLSASTPRGRFAINDQTAGHEITFEPPAVPREPAYGRTAVYTQVSPGTPGNHGVDVGKGLSVKIVTDSSGVAGPESARSLVVVLSIPSNVSGEVSIQLPPTGQASQLQPLRAMPVPGLRISDSPE
ncbi:MAG: hypothetical protein HY914_06465 [Desulfomonile tiedjei]|nr:hypothetical protein [Desulfomonile tiedjei]